ncbi:MAG: COX15/CtaA family protein [Actinomycetota bacterium]|nr:COX15/CtaA family protein [Actinomycetota bacterium]
MTVDAPDLRTAPRRLSPDAYLRICGVVLVLLAGIVVTGAGVRLTGSGLGCSDWPTCEQDRFVPEAEIHGWIEFGNRLITGLVSIAVIAAVLGSLARSPRRSDLVRWSWGLVAGVIGQVVLGGIVVISHLNPWLVLGHFALSMVLVFNAVVLHHRAGDHARPGPRAVVPLVRRLTGLLTGLAVVVLASGTLVTGTGPHTGSREDPIERLPFAVQEVARVHGTIVVLVLIVVATLTLAVRRHVPSGDPLRQTVRWLIAVVVAQAVIGWTQYFTGVPVVLVGLHVAGATALWMVVVKLRLLATDVASATSDEGGSGR